MDSAAFLERIKARCATHRGPTAGFCRECFCAELEDVLCEEHPDMKRGDAFELVQQWLATADALVN